jgi:phosphoribosylformylglycinamidine cyclo-ligase
MTVTTYKDAGVDIKRADDVLNRIKHRITATFNQHVLTSIGGFGALSEVPKQYKDPILVSSTDGVGTKLKIAFNVGKHDTVGIDLVAMSANDVLTTGARPFFFLDYFATGHIEEHVYESVITGICEGCKMAQCALIGGETAEMPSFYREGEYDLAGFAMGFVERDKIVNGSTIREGDVVIGLASSGLHSNGFSLVRKVLFEIHNLKACGRVEGLSEPLFEALLRPTRIYVKPVTKILDRFVVKGMAHITGGGLPGNISRIIPGGLAVSLTVSQSRVPEIFKLIQKLGNITDGEMCSTFNMGIGYVLVIDQKDEQAILVALEESGETAFRLGTIEKTSKTETVQIVFNP